MIKSGSCSPYKKKLFTDHYHVKEIILIKTMKFLLNYLKISNVVSRNSFKFILIGTNKKEDYVNGAEMLLWQHDFKSASPLLA